MKREPRECTYSAEGVFYDEELEGDVEFSFSGTVLLKTTAK